jgi:uncharacterized membrane protein YgcG
MSQMQRLQHSAALITCQHATCASPGTCFLTPTHLHQPCMMDRPVPMLLLLQGWRVEDMLLLDQVNPCTVSRFMRFTASAGQGGGGGGGGGGSGASGGGGGGSSRRSKRAHNDGRGGGHHCCKGKKGWR